MRSTVKVAAFSGMFTGEPVEGVRVMVLTETTKDNKLVLGGGVSGVAVMVKLRVAWPLFVQLVVQGLGMPLQAAKERAERDSSAAKTCRKFMQSPRRSGAEQEQAQTQRFKVTTLSRRKAKIQVQNEGKLLNC